MLDGFRLINKENIDEILREEDEIFKEKIFKLKYTESKAVFNCDLNKANAVFSELQTQNLLFHFDMEDEEVIIVGKVEEVQEKSFTIKTLNSVGQWDESCTILHTNVSSVAVGNDYLNSLSLLLK